MDWRSRLRAPQKLSLADLDPTSTPGFDGNGKDAARHEADALLDDLSDLQTRVYAAKSHGILVVLQGRDTSGKDGSIRKVLSRINPLGFSVHGFTVPTDEEASHDFLWRAHRVAPGRGEVVAFNRSHYEDVLVRRFDKIDAAEPSRPRYDAV